MSSLYASFEGMLNQMRLIRIIGREVNALTELLSQFLWLFGKDFLELLIATLLELSHWQEF
jgi:hypothetical protein